ncbi:hypothetical protein PVAP13_2KG284280 [Panicum virgatum]|uniref:Uncharacterized protein n=1 Tax=Panicum virgatum TaxID=38727 RepID=A0A8T0WGN5_PANVG|nr:hypothetical protein PVAP13_2KG284280 [Panicum virgatum]
MGDKLHHLEGNSLDHQLRPLNDCSVIKGGGGAKTAKRFDGASSHPLKSV